EGDWCEAYFSFELALHANPTAMEHLTQWRLSDQRAAATIRERYAWDAVGRRLSLKTKPELLEAMKAVVARLGYNNLVESVVRSIIITGPSNELFEIFCSMVERSDAREDPGWPASQMRPLTESFVQSGGLELVEKIFAHVQAMVTAQTGQQASLEAWYG